MWSLNSNTATIKHGLPNENFSARHGYGSMRCEPVVQRGARESASVKQELVQLAYPAPENALQATGKDFKVHPVLDPEYDNRMMVMGVTSCFLLGYEDCPTGGSLCGLKRS